MVSKLRTDIPFGVQSPRGQKVRSFEVQNPEKYFVDGIRRKTLAEFGDKISIFSKLQKVTET